MGFSLLPITSPSTLERCLGCSVELPLVVVCSYPKSGTTWMQAIVANVLLHPVVPAEHISQYTPFLEADKTWEKVDGGLLAANHRALGCFACNSHLLPEMTSLSARQDNKVIYVVRNGRDVCTSFFHHLKNQRGSGGDFSQDFKSFVTEWCAGTLPYGLWLDHVLVWLREQSARPEQVLVVRYRDLKQALPACIERISCFLGRPLGADTAREMEPRLCFSGMQGDIGQYQPQSVEWAPGFCFIREGGEGAAFDAECEAVYQTMLQERLVGVSPDLLAALSALDITQ